MKKLKIGLINALHLILAVTLIATVSGPYVVWKELKTSPVSITSLLWGFALCILNVLVSIFFTLIVLKMLGVEV